MELQEDRIINGLLKADIGFLAPEAVRERLSQDVVISVDPKRAVSDDLWPCIWLLAAALERQFTGADIDRRRLGVATSRTNSAEFSVPLRFWCQRWYPNLRRHTGCGRVGINDLRRHTRERNIVRESRAFRGQGQSNYLLRIGWLLGLRRACSGGRHSAVSPVLESETIANAV